MLLVFQLMCKEQMDKQVGDHEMYSVSQCVCSLKNGSTFFRLLFHCRHIVNKPISVYKSLYTEY